MTSHPQHVRRAFAAAAHSYDEHATLQRTVAAQCVRHARAAFTPDMQVLDAGAGTGNIASLMQGEPHPRLLALDIAFPMCRQARTYHRDVLCADMARLPLRAGAVDGVISSLALQWADDPGQVLAEMARMTRPGGHAVIATLGPRTLHEMASAFRAADGNPRIQAFPAQDALVERAIHAGWRMDACEEEIVTHFHPDLSSLMRALKSIGAHRHPTARPGLTARGLFSAAQSHYRANHGTPRGLPATWQVYYLLMTRGK